MSPRGVVIPGEPMGGTRRSWRAALAGTVAVCALGAAALGQGANGGGVTGEGIAAIERAPELLRMQVTIAASGKGAKDAIANLRTQEKAAREKLAALGA